MKKLTQSSKLSWRRDDFERRLAFPGERYLKVGALSSGVLALISTLLFYCAVFLAPESDLPGTRRYSVSDRFFRFLDLFPSLD